MMPPQTKKSLLSRFDAQSGNLAAQIAADTSLPMQGFQDPPPGIRNGIAQLDEVKFDVYKSGENEGKEYFTATAFILEPDVHTYTPTSRGEAIGEPVNVETRGMVTRIQPITIADTVSKSGKNMGKTTPWQEHAKTAAQHMRGLGADTSKVKKISDLVAIAESLTRVARNPNTPIYIRFSTSVRQAMNAGDADGVWQNWHGTAGLDNYVPPDTTVVLTNGQERSPTSPSRGRATKPEIDDNSSEGTTTEEDLTTADLDNLLSLAEDNTEAQDEILRRAAEATGRTAEDINNNATSWEEVVQMIRDSESSDPDSDNQASEPPRNGDHFNYTPMVKGLGGKMMKAKKPVECTVTSVSEANETVTLKSMVDGKTIYKDVPWDELADVQ